MTGQVRRAHEGQVGAVTRAVGALGLGVGQRLARGGVERGAPTGAPLQVGQQGAGGRGAGTQVAGGQAAQPQTRRPGQLAQRVEAVLLEAVRERRRQRGHGGDEDGGARGQQREHEPEAQAARRAPHARHPPMR